PISRGIAWMDPKGGADYVLKLNDDALKSAAAQQHGRYLVVTHFQDKGGKSIDIRDVTTGTTLWTRDFPKSTPLVYMDDVSEKVIVLFSGDSARNESKHDSDLRELLAEWKKNEQRTELAEILDAATGKTEASLVITATGDPAVT